LLADGANIRQNPQGGTADAQNPPLDRQLLIERWPTLSQAVQQQIMLLVG